MREPEDLPEYEDRHRATRDRGIMDGHWIGLIVGSILALMLVHCCG